MSRREDATLSGRIKIAMVAAGIRNQSELANRVKTHRQTISKWMTGQSDELTPEMLFRLSDVLRVNARWLAFGPPFSPVKPTQLDPDTVEILQIRDALQQANPRASEKWIEDGRELMSLLSPKSVANPFAKIKAK